MTKYKTICAKCELFLCKFCVKECYNYEINQMNSEPLTAPTQSNNKMIIDHLLKKIEQLKEENTELKHKLNFYENTYLSLPGSFITFLYKRFYFYALLWYIYSLVCLNAV